MHILLPLGGKPSHVVRHQRIVEYDDADPTPDDNISPTQIDYRHEMKGNFV